MVSEPTGAAGEGPVPRRPPAMATKILQVNGMTCGACTSAVEGAFKDVAGAGDVSVSLIMGRAAVRFDPSVLRPEKIAEMIEDCGFDATVLSTEVPSHKDSVSDGEAAQFSVTNLAIDGITCGACTSAVDSGLKDVPGIKSVSESLSERGVVEHDTVI
ncbi:hypothetical protein N7486_011475 [Penicillium sp. IBT 16267x]|nr:hypothetical protein N7486_011475 [Penicillium sp. IBT 16267x]